MKKIFLFLVLVCVITFQVFSQETEESWEKKRRHVFTTNLTPLFMSSFLGGFGINAGYEYALGPYGSLKINGTYMGFRSWEFDYYDDNIENYFVALLRFNAEGRWYPMGDYFKRWFLGGGLQYHWISISPFVDDKNANQGAHSVSLVLGVGYKFIIGKPRAALVIEPLLEYAARIYSGLESDTWSYFNPFEWLLGINGPRFSLLFGVAF